MHTDLSPRATEIVDHARALLAIGGYNGFSYADISERVRIGKASIHHHFPSKAELVQTVVVRYRAEARAGMAAMEQSLDDPAAQIDAFVAYWSECILDGTPSICICAMLAAEMPAIPREVADEVRGHFQDLAAWLAKVFERGVGTGQFELTDSPVVEARSFMATVHGAMVAARAFNEPSTFDAIVHAAMGRLKTAT